MRTYEHAKATDHLGRYYTQNAVSQMLVGLLPVEMPASVLDLGAGEGSLSIAASSKWSDAALITIDVDHAASEILSRRLLEGKFRGRHHHLPSDALSLRVRSLLSAREISPPSVAVCNPPFLVPRWRKGYSQILEEAGFSGALPAISSTDAAVIFLAQNLRLLANGGTLGIIVPDSLVCAEKYKCFRAALMEKYDIVQAIRLPRGSFVGTDALAHILVITNSRPSSDTVRLSCFSTTHGILEEIKVARDQAIQRLDYTFHAAKSSAKTSSKKLSDITLDLRRGNLNSAQVKANSNFILHTTDITDDMSGQWIDFEGCSGIADEKKLATASATTGDIIIARVGRNAAKKVIGVANGHIPLSDCLYRLRVNPQHQKALLHELSSPTGQLWLEMHAYGVAARHICKGDLLNFPLSYE